MNRQQVLPLVVVVAAVAAFTFTFAEETRPADEGVMCPVMNEQIDPSVKLATDEGPIYFCCTGCIKKYNKEPAKFAEKVAEERKALADAPQVQVTCPVSNEPIDSAVFTEHEGQKVYFCCPKCKPKFEAEPAKYQAALANSQTLQTTCPLSGEPIDAKEFLDTTNGQRIYFCCPKCKGKLTANPAEYKEKLAALHIAVDPTTVPQGS